MFKSCWNIIGNSKGKAFVIVLVVILMVVAIGYNITETEAKSKVIRLKFSSSFFPPEPPNVQAFHTLDLVEKRSNGRVKIKRFVGGALGGPHEQLGLASSGAADIISLHIDQYAQELPLHQITNTEQLVSNARGLENMIALMREIPKTRKFFEAEQKKNNIKILYFHVNGATGITPRFKAKSLADLKGKKVNVIAAFHRDVFNEMGWIPVNVQIPELYEGLSRGVIDAIFMATAANLPMKWNEAGETHLILGDNTMISAPLAFNLDSWNKLPKDIQKLFMDASRETAYWSVKMNDDFLKTTYDAFKKAGKDPVVVSKKEREKFFKILFKHQERNNMKIAKTAGVLKEAKIIQGYWNKMRWGKWKK